ncbi:MAG: nickel-dependent hydrogenase large subunit [Candidatus Altiarchaeota archaeon]
MEVEVPVGTVHPALLEPFRIRFLVEDEVVEDCEITFNAAHRGIERILEGLPIQNANMVTERICGICSGIHLWNSCRVSEMALDVRITPRANWIRVLSAELERLHSHTLFFGHAFEVLGHETFSYRSFALREPIMTVLQAFTGNRVHYAVPIIGGVRPRCDLTEKTLKIVNRNFKGAKEKITAYIERILRDPLIESRLEGTGILENKVAEKLHAVGPTGRASGIQKDWRKDIPEYESFDFDMIVLEDGDNKTRVVSRALEVLESVKIIEQILAGLPEGDLVVPWERKASGFKESYMEAPRGELYHSLSLDEEGKVRHYKIRPPTTTTLGPVEEACVGDHLTDAILTIASCDPCLCCANRAIVVDADKKKERMLTYEQIKARYKK